MGIGVPLMQARQGTSSIFISARKSNTESHNRELLSATNKKIAPNLTIGADQRLLFFRKLYRRITLQPSGNASYPTLQLRGMVILVKREQPLNAEKPIQVTLSGIVTLVKLEHPLKAPLPIKVTLLGIVTLVNLEQP